MPTPTTAQEVYIAALFAEVDKSADRLERSIAHQIEVTEKLTLALGATAGSINEMNLSADRLVQSKLIDLNNHVNQMVGVTIKNVIEQSLNAAVAKEIQSIRKEVGIIRSSLEEMHKRSFRSQLGAAAGVGLLATSLVLSIAWYAISNGMIHLRDVATPVAQQAASNVKQLPKVK